MFGDYDGGKEKLEEGEELRRGIGRLRRYAMRKATLLIGRSEGYSTTD